MWAAAITMVPPNVPIASQWMWLHPLFKPQEAADCNSSTASKEPVDCTEFPVLIDTVTHEHLGRSCKVKVATVVRTGSVDHFPKRHNKSPTFRLAV
ncbi:hypothetical protein AAFF_G00092020 [Aldrovandia affinis]|uniref:Uncharacterized protein n=1 Tax=Aldrovandia affinis TaxID=143900 RepID=A0AAD7T2L6_9TELE|nr:hypothetical protein AAFF_G00092020 [Aldrovandia affinis]